MTAPAKPARPAPAPKSPSSLRPVASLLFMEPTEVPGYTRHRLKLVAGAQTDAFPGVEDRSPTTCPPMFRCTVTGDFKIGPDWYGRHTVRRWRHATMASGKAEG